MLTARALATFLASQDHPEEGLCNNPPVKVIGGDVNDSHLGDNSHESFQRRIASALETMLDQHDETKSMVDRMVEEKRDFQVSKVKSDVKEKDSKSFAQNLFDTRSMRRLTLTEPLSTVCLESQLPQIAAESRGQRKDEIIPAEDNYTVPNTCHPRNDGKALRREQHRAWQDMHGYHSKPCFVFLKRDFRTHEFIASTPDNMLPYFSCSNILSLCRGAGLTIKGRESKERKEWLDMQKLFNRQIAISHSFEPDFGHNTQTIQYVCFIRRSINYICNNPHALMRSFVEWKDEKLEYTTVRSYPFEVIAHIFCLLGDREGSNLLISNSWLALDAIECAYFGIGSRGSLETKESNKSSSASQISRNVEAAHIAKIALAALVSHIGSPPNETLTLITRLRRQGFIEPPNILSKTLVDNFMLYLDSFENEAAVAFATRLAKSIGYRRWQEIRKSKGWQLDEQEEKKRHYSSFLALLVRNIADREGLRIHADTLTNPASFQEGTDPELGDHHVFAGQDKLAQSKLIIIEWMRNVIIKEWDGKAEVPRNSAIGGALELLKYMCKQRHQVGISS